VALNPYLVMHVLQSHLMSLGSIKNVQIGEPKQPPADDLTAAILMDGIRTPRLMLDARVLVYDVIIRLYRNFTDDGRQTEEQMARSVGEVMEAFAGDFTLGGNIRAVDFGGMYGAGMKADWGHLDFGPVMFRTASITVPLIVDPAAEFVA
jgi:hypothetical protein